MGFKGLGSTVGPKPVVTQASWGRKDKAPVVGQKSLVGPKLMVLVTSGSKHSGKVTLTSFKPTIPSVTMLDRGSSSGFAMSLWSR